MILLDNGRTNVLADPTGRQALRCIRCSACLNVCPVYERTGGHAYGSVYPGPIGAILAPQLRGGVGERSSDAQTDSLPFASSLGGACFEACPVRIDIPEVLVHLRSKGIDAQRELSPRISVQDVAMKAASWALSSSSRLGMAERAANVVGRLAARFGRAIPGGRTVLGPLPGPLSDWSDSRDIALPTEESFRQWWSRTDGGRAEANGTDDAREGLR